MSTISIAGTALSITLIMLLVLIYQIQTTNIVPEVNRDRTLYAESILYRKSNGKQNFGGSMSPRVVKEVFYSLKTAQASAFTFLRTSYLTTSDEQRRMKGYSRPTDHNYFNIYQYNFLKGRPFSCEEFESGMKRVVISEKVARSCYGGAEEAMGQTLMINFEAYEVCGVVEDVSSLLRTSYADIWVPYSSLKWYPWPGTEDTMGDFDVLLLKNPSNDYDKVVAEVEESFNRFNAGLSEGKIELQSPVRTHLIWAMGGLINIKDMGHLAINIGLILGILLLVPALNLSSITVSQMRNRISEIGIRKAYGAIRRDIINQIIIESMILTVIGGMIGVISSYALIKATTEMLLSSRFSDLSSSSYLSIDMVLSPVFFLYAIIFCLILNLMSALIPAWKASKITIINAIRT